MPTLYVVRHAQPNIKGLLTGQSDPELSADGREQASRLTGLEGIVYSSPLRRAIQTARYIARKPVILPELAEITYGEWDGLSWTEIERRWPRIAREKLAAWETVTPPGGESWSEFKQRVTAALEIALRGQLPAVIVAHEAVNAIIAGQLMSSRVEAYRQQYCEIRKYDLRPLSEPGESRSPTAGFAHEAGWKPGPS